MGRVEVVVDVGDEVWTDSDVFDADDLGQMLVVVNGTIDRRVVLIDEAGEEVDADYATGCRDAAKLFVSEVAVVIAEGSGGRMRRDDRTRRDLEDVFDACRAEVRDVEEDSQSVHLANDRNARPRQSTTRLILAASVREECATHVGERDHPNAEFVEDLEEALVGSECKGALHR